jgi:hypothetical protein
VTAALAPPISVGHPVEDVFARPEVPLDVWELVRDRGIVS